MRTSLFLTTLFAVSLTGGAALAEKPQGTTAREPRVMENLRAHGDTVDKSYTSPAAARASGSAGAAGSSVTRTQAPTQQARGPFDHSASRINCSDTGADCVVARGKIHESAPEASSASTGRAVQPPAFLDKILGSDRTNFNEAGEDMGMSEKAANRAWAHAAGQVGGHNPGAGATLPLAAQQQVDRHSEQRSTARMSCNEGEECTMSSKAANKEWAVASIKAGTWKGPAREPVSIATRRIAADRAAESASLHDEKVAHEKADHPGGSAGHAGAAAAPQGDAH